MKNKQNITIEDIRKHYKPSLSDSCDQISNLSDQTLGYYAWFLQEKIQTFIYQKKNEVDSDFFAPLLSSLRNANAQNSEATLIDAPLTMESALIENAQISYTHTQFNENIALHNFELSFEIPIGCVQYPIVLRNGYLFRCLEESLIQDFEEIDSCEATVIFHPANSNPHICAFVRFKKP